ncbi:MAG: hypothetical protein H6574_14320 [Lewinellaceae bacterium]|nr:hypothetical protein [Lewinellaceae bacterium]MCB9332255.1 hypothetical protein [Lewinellaceae bacterium]
MENDEKILNPQESLRVIRETIDLAKNSIRENGFHFLLWGWLVVLACIADYYLDVVVQYPNHFLAWIAMAVIGLPTALIYEWRREKKDPSTFNTIRGWYGRVWLAFGISLFLVLVLTVRAQVSPVPYILVLVGFATFISGSLLRFAPLIFGAVVMWVAAIICMMLGYQEHLLVQALATVAGYLVPGYIMSAKARNKHV